MKMKYVSLEAVLDILNECEDIKGFAYTSFHDALMKLPVIEEKDGDEDE